MSPDQGLALLQKAFIPQINWVILEKYNEQAPDTSAVIPKGSQLIVLTSRGGLETVGRVKECHALAFEALKRETQKAVDTAHKNLALQVEDAKLQPQELENPQMQSTAEKALIVKISEEKLPLSKLGEQEN